MSKWRTLRKTGVLLHISYSQTFTNNLWAEHISLRTSPQFELSMDLNGNLRTRNKLTNTYQDARELADGEIDRLELVQLDDARIIDGITRELEGIEEPPSEWRLTIHLDGERSFKVRPEATRQGDARLLFLYVVPVEVAHV